MWAPSNATPSGQVPTANVPRLAPSLARSLVTLSLPKFVTHTLAPSQATPSGKVPTGNVPRLVPSQARTLLTLLSLLFATHMFPPSKANPNGNGPAAKLAVRFAAYQRKMAACRKLICSCRARSVRRARPLCMRFLRLRELRTCALPSYCVQKMRECIRSPGLQALPQFAQLSAVSPAEKYVQSG